LQTAGVYVAGFVDPGVRGSEQMYDLFIDGAVFISSLRAFLSLSLIVAHILP
jgi:hypothetical protein